MTTERQYKHSRRRCKRTAKIAQSSLPAEVGSTLAIDCYSTNDIGTHPTPASFSSCRAPITGAEPHFQSHCSVRNGRVSRHDTINQSSSAGAARKHAPIDWLGIVPGLNTETGSSLLLTSQETGRPALLQEGSFALLLLPLALHRLLLLLQP